MTTKDFMSKAVNYYNKAYTIHQASVVSGALDRLNDDLKADILLRIIDTYSIRFRCPPGVSEIMEAYEYVKVGIDRVTKDNLKKCHKCGRPIFSDFCPECDDKPDIDKIKNMKDIFNNG